jgi:dipeptidyl aminopeptidase/acylaminoacyl peptidase
VTRPASPSGGFSVTGLGRWLAPALSVAGLLIVAIVTLNLLQGQVPFVGGSTGNGNGDGDGNGGPIETPAPSNVIVVPPEVITFKGSIVYAKAGNIWVQSGKDARQLTTGGRDSMPSWSPDGSMVYFVRTVDGEGRWPSQGVTRTYLLSTPSVMRIKADGSSDKAELVLSGKVKQAGRTWQAWIREPTLSPNGRTLALVSDLPDPTQSDVVLQFYDLQNDKSRVPKLPESPPLGHQDPEWRPDGKELLYVRNGRSGQRGSPTIWRWSVASSKAVPFTGPGYLEPSYSPDGRFVAATKTSTFGNDIVILDAANGRELLRVTNDGGSWAPAWSPIGDAIAFLHIKHSIIDLKLARLDGAAPSWTVKDITSLTEVSGLDGESRPGWFVPANELPAPPAAPSAPASASPAQ